VVTNSGLVVSAEDDAIRFVGGNNTLNLLAPSFIGGRINFGDGATVNITTGASHSVLWDFSTGSLAGDAPNVDGAVAGFFNADTKQFATLDPTGFAASFDSLGDMTSLLSNVGRQGLSGRFSSRYGSAYGMKDKDAGGDPPIAYGKSLWVTPFGGRTKHGGDDATLDRDITQAGLALGYRWQHQPDLSLGVMAGYVSDEAEAESRFAKSHESEADSFFAGFSGRKQWGNLFLDFALMGGVMSHDQDRFVNDNLAPLGVSFANASFDSRFISPEAGLSMNFDMGHGLTITPGARLRYAAQWLDGYTESGSNANATVDDRMLGLIEGSAEIAATQQFDFGSVTARLGILSRTSTGDDDVTITLIGVDNTVAFGTDDDVAAYVGLGASIHASDNLKLELDGQAVFGDDIIGIQGLARLTHSF
jgi:hypothetical protein